MDRKIRIGSWNIGSLTGRARELVDVMVRRKVKILGIQETKWKGNSARPVGEGYKVYYAGRTTRRNGVGIILHPELQPNVIEVLRVSDRLMAMRLIMNGKIWHLVSGYAPQQGCPEEEKEAFRDMFEEHIRGVREEEVLFIMADLNAHAGESNQGYEDFHGGKGFGRRHEEGERILEIAEASNLMLINTLFTKRRSHLITYSSGQNESQIDFILTTKRNRKMVEDCKVIPGEAVVSQHRLLVADIKIGKKKRNKLVVKEKRIKIWKLKEDGYQQELRTKVEECIERENLHDVEGKDINAMWNELKTTVTTAAADVCGWTSERARRETDSWWWTADVQGAVSEKKAAFRALKNDQSDAAKRRYNESKSRTKTIIAREKNKAYRDWYEQLNTREGEKNIYRIAKCRNKNRQDIQGVRFIKDGQGNILCEDDKIKKRWEEYFSNLLNTENEHNRLPLVEPTQGPVQSISLGEVKAAIKKGKPNKAPGSSKVSLDLIKALGETGEQWMHKVIEKVWEEEVMPDDWKMSEMVTLYKQKGDSLECGNYRGIKLLEHSLKIMERVIDKRLRQLIEINELQFGFMPGRGATDAMFIARQLQEKALEGNRKVYMGFVDLEKAYDRIPREVVYWCLRKRGVPDKIIRVIRMMYEGSETTIRTPYGNTRSFRVNVGVHQGSALSPFLFLVVLDTLSRELRDEELWEMLFADDLIIIAETLDQLQERYLAWEDKLEGGGAKVNTDKTEIMVSRRGMREEAIMLAGNGQELKQVASFRYLGAVITEEGGTEEAVKLRIKEAWRKWSELSGVILDKKIPLKLRMKIYKTVLRPVLLYGGEIWALRKKEESLLERTEMRMVRWITGISLRQRMESEMIRRMAGICNIKEKAREARLRYLGHVLRRDHQHPIRRAYEEPVRGMRSVGRQRLRWKDVIRKDMEAKGLREEDAANRNRWRLKTRAADPAIQWD